MAAVCDGLRETDGRSGGTDGLAAGGIVRLSMSVYLEMPSSSCVVIVVVIFVVIIIVVLANETPKFQLRQIHK